MTYSTTPLTTHPGLTSGLLKTFALSSVALLATQQVSAQAIVTFEPSVPGVPPAGTAMGGTTGNTPGDLFFTEDGVDVYVDSYTLGGFVGFNSATIDGFTGYIFPTTPVTLNNIRLDFDLSGLAPVNYASFEYADFGGSENLVINGAVWELPDFGSAPASIAGVNIKVIPTSAITGLVELTGPINTLAIGGQELGIDNVRFAQKPQ